MSQALRGLGLLLVLAGAVLLLAQENTDEPLPVPPVTIMGLGVVAFVAGLVLSAAGRAGRAVARRTCARCGTAISAGDVYCHEHFREAIDRIKDSDSA